MSGASIVQVAMAANGATAPAWLPYATLGISILAICVALTGLVFTIVKSYRLEGGRVIVSFYPGLWEPGALLMRYQSKDGSIPSVRPSGRGPSDTIARGVECAIVEIENAGRVGVTILEAGIEFKGKRGNHKFWKREHSHIVPRSFRSNSFSVGTVDTESKSIRLDPYSHALYLLDVHTVIDAARNAIPPRRRGRPRTIKLRASVKVAGRRKRALSRRRRQWRVPANAASLLDLGPTIRIEALIALELAREFNSKPKPDDDNSSLEYVSRLIAASLWDARDNPDIDDRVDFALQNEHEVCYFFENDRWSILSYKLGVILRTRAEMLDWTGAEHQSELNASARHRHKARAQHIEPDTSDGDSR